MGIPPVLYRGPTIQLRHSPRTNRYYSMGASWPYQGMFVNISIIIIVFLAYPVTRTTRACDQEGGDIAEKRRQWVSTSY